MEWGQAHEKPAGPPKMEPVLQERHDHDHDRLVRQSQTSQPFVLHVQSVAVAAKQLGAQPEQEPCYARAVSEPEESAQPWDGGQPGDGVRPLLSGAQQNHGSS